MTWLVVLWLAVGVLAQLQGAWSQTFGAEGAFGLDEAAFGGPAGPFTLLTYSTCEAPTRAPTAGPTAALAPTSPALTQFPPPLPEIQRMLVPLVGTACVSMPRYRQNGFDGGLDNKIFWTVKSMSGDLIDIVIYSSSTCNAAASTRFTTRPGDCVDPVPLFGPGASFNKWVRFFAPESIPGGFTAEAHKSLQDEVCSSRTRDDTSLFPAGSSIAGRAPGNRHSDELYRTGRVQFCREVPIGLPDGNTIKRNITYGCLGYGGRAVWAEVASCAYWKARDTTTNSNFVVDSPLAKANFNLVGRKCRTTSERGCADCFTAGLSFEEINELGIGGAPLVKLEGSSAILTCFGTASNSSADADWWIPSAVRQRLIAQARAEEPGAVAPTTSAPTTSAPTPAAPTPAAPTAGSVNVALVASLAATGGGVLAALVTFFLFNRRTAAADDFPIASRTA
jgi:hypothetical protein